MRRRISNPCWVLAVGLTLLPQSGRAQPDDRFPANSVWVNESMGLTLTVLEREGETFRGKLAIRSAIERTIAGTVRGNKIAWLAKDTLAVKGGPGSDNFGTIRGDRIDFEYVNKGTTGKFSVQRRAAAASPVPAQLSSGTVPPLDEGSFERWRDYLRPNAEELEWMKIGWRPSFRQALIEAQKKAKPLLVWTAAGNPCGYT